MSQNLPYATSCIFFTRFVSRLRRFAGRDFRYIAVPEFQKRGATHWHVLIWGFYHEAQEERATRRFQRLWLRGFVDCVITDGHDALSGYLGKYLSKALSDLRLGNKKAYYASRNILRPLHVGSGNESIQDILQKEVIPTLEPLTVREFDSQWLGKVEYKVYNTKHYDNSKEHKDKEIRAPRGNE